MTDKEKRQAVEAGLLYPDKKPIINISPYLYKAMKSKEMAQEKMIHMLHNKITILESIIDDQNVSISKLERIIDSLL